MSRIAQTVALATLATACAPGDGGNTDDTGEDVYTRPGVTDDDLIDFLDDNDLVTGMGLGPGFEYDEVGPVDPATGSACTLDPAWGDDPFTAFLGLNGTPGALYVGFGTTLTPDSKDFLDELRNAGATIDENRLWTSGAVMLPFDLQDESGAMVDMVDVAGQFLDDDGEPVARAELVDAAGFPPEGSWGGDAALGVNLSFEDGDLTQLLTFGAAITLDAAGAVTGPESFFAVNIRDDQDDETACSLLFTVPE